MKLRPTLLAQLNPARASSLIWDMGDWKSDTAQRLENRVGFILARAGAAIRLGIHISA